MNDKSTGTHSSSLTTSQGSGSLGTRANAKGASTRPDEEQKVGERVGDQSDGDSQARSQQPASASDQSGSDDITSLITKGVAAGLQKVTAAPELSRIGEAVANAVATATGPVRRSLRSQPTMSGIGLGALAFGGVFLGIALIRDSQGNKGVAAREPQPRVN